MTPEVARHAAVLDRMLTAAEALLARGDAGGAAAIAQSAAGLVVLNHPGRFADARVEALLARCAEAALDAVPWTGGEGVLHVLSNTSQVGGHTRLAWRWMARDAGRRHSFVVPRPFGAPPSSLVAAAHATGGTEHHVPGVEEGPVATAQALRALAARHDLVVLHVQPNDVLAVLALAGVRDRAPTLLCDHADHCFWLGRDAADVVVGHRPFAARLTHTRRGVPVARTATVPLPLDGEVAGTDPATRAAARTRLGLDDDLRVLLTIGTAYKFAMGERHLLDAVEPLVLADPGTVLIAAGPPAEGRWAEAHARTGGRVIAAGVVPDLSDLLAAADVLVEAYPCSSGTAALEAAQTGLPVVAWAPEVAEADMLGSAGAAARLWPSFAGDEELRAALVAAVPADGAATRAAVAAHHAPDAWLRAVRAAEAQARVLGPIARAELAPPPQQDDVEDRLLLALHLESGHAHPPEALERLAAQAEAVARWPQLDALFTTGLVGHSTHLELRRGFGPMVAAPAAGEEALVVEALRTLLRSGIVPSATVLLEQAAAPRAIPALQAALDAGDEVDLDVALADAPAAHVLPGVAALRTPEDRFADALPPGAPHLLAA